MALTDKALRTAKPRDKAYKLYDEGGLYIQITPSGGKWWRFKYRFEGKEKLLSFGTYPDVPLVAARRRRDDARMLLAGDPPKDPSAKRQDEKAAKLANKTNTFEKWAEKWWNNWHKDKSPRHAEYVKRRLEADIFPSIGNLPINEIEAHQVVTTIKAIAERGALDIAKRSHQMIGQVFRYAIAHNKESKAKRNPASDIKPSH